MRYYFSKLDKEGREIYKKLYFGMQNFEKKISLKGTENIVREIYYMIIKDNPMMFFVHPSKLTYFKIGNYVWIEPIYVYRKEEANQIMNEINIKLKPLEKKLKTINTKLERERFIHKYLLENVRYKYNCSEDDFECHTIVGSFLYKQAVCDGISKAFKQLCDLARINCNVVFGDSWNEYEKPQKHAWNMVKIDKDWYHIDVTWNINLSQRFKYVRYDYFNIRESDVIKDHRNFDKLEICDSLKNNFFYENKCILNGRNELEKFWYDEHTKEGYEFIKTPIMMSKELWEVSGHWYNYKENMYTSLVDEREFAIKPMNCPGSLLVYKNGLHSYKDLPIRMGELGQVHRHEASGALNGLFRVRTFTQDDAHIFMTPDQIESEVVRLIAFIDRVYSMLGLSYDIELSTRPEEKYIGELEIWEKSEAALAAACQAAGKDYKINPGDGAFYGPKLDFHVKDSLGRVWQCGTIQLDMNLPERFDLTYVDQNGEKVRPVMVHRVIFGSIERFIGILIEHFAGAFPLWLAPAQVKVIPVKNEYHLDYSQEIFKLLEAKGIRVEIDDREEKLGYRIREAQMKKIPYQLVLGDKERDERTVTYRQYGEQKQTTVSLDEFICMILKQIEDKAL